MSCDTNTHKVTVLGDLEYDKRGRHRRDDDHDHDSRVGLKDLIEVIRDGEGENRILSAIKDGAAANVRETLEAKFAVGKAVAEGTGAVLTAIAGIGEKVQETKFELAVKALEAQNQGLRDLLAFGRDRKCGRD
jgi:hypothetical protein